MAHQRDSWILAILFGLRFSSRLKKRRMIARLLPWILRRAAARRKNIEDGTNSDDSLYADVPFFTNERLAIQKGVFVFSLNLHRTFHDLLIQNQKVVVQLMIPKNLFSAI